MKNLMMLLVMGVVTVVLGASDCMAAQSTLVGGTFVTPDVMFSKQNKMYIVNTDRLLENRRTEGIGGFSFDGATVRDGTVVYENFAKLERAPFNRLVTTGFKKEGSFEKSFFLTSHTTRSSYSPVRELLKEGDLHNVTVSSNLIFKGDQGTMPVLNSNEKAIIDRAWDNARWIDPINERLGYRNDRYGNLIHRDQYGQQHSQNGWGIVRVDSRDGLSDQVEDKCRLDWHDLRPTHVWSLPSANGLADGGSPGNNDPEWLVKARDLLKHEADRKVGQVQDDVVVAA